MENISKIWPQWKVEELISQGANGNIYKIKREEMGHIYQAAVKVIKLPSDKREINDLLSAGMDYASIRSYYEDTVQKLRDEIRIMETLKTAENIVSIENYSFEEEKEEIGWTAYIQMELLESLGSYIQNKGQTGEILGAKEIVKIGIDICSAISCCEREKIIHGDIKPEHIFRNKYGTYKLGDFGISKQVEKMQRGTPKTGTIAYMAPEVYWEQGYGNTVDIYSLGITMYRLLNNYRLPFCPIEQSISMIELENAIRKRMNGEYLEAPANADNKLAKIVLKACAFDAKDRYQSAEAMKKELEKWQLENTYGAYEQVIARPGTDARKTITISKDDAKFGCMKRISTPAGKEVDIMIPAEIKDGQNMRFVGLGNPGTGGGINGNLYIIIKIEKNYEEKSPQAPVEEKTEKNTWSFGGFFKKEKKARFCVKCGKVLSGDADFCTACGTPIRRY